jgi:large subunit ribosomal protein L35
LGTEFRSIEETLKKNKKLKLKTHRGAAKRFKVTSTGKVMRAHSGKRHLLGTKRPKRMRHLRKSTMVNESDMKRVRRMLPYS